jgi:hypothetical protein
VARRVVAVAPSTTGRGPRTPSPLRSERAVVAGVGGFAGRAGLARNFALIATLRWPRGAWALRSSSSSRLGLNPRRPAIRPGSSWVTSVAGLLAMGLDLAGTRVAGLRVVGLGGNTSRPLCRSRRAASASRSSTTPGGGRAWSRVVHDGCERAVEVQAQRDLAGPRGQLGGRSSRIGHDRSRANSCRPPGRSSTLSRPTRTVIGRAEPGRELMVRRFSANATSTRCPR